MADNKNELLQQQRSILCPMDQVSTWRSPMPNCPYCNTSDNTPLEFAIPRLADCANCRLDLEMKGKWTGYGFAIMEALIKQHGFSAVDVEWERMQNIKAQEYQREKFSGGRRGGA